MKKISAFVASLVLVCLLFSGMAPRAFSGVSDRLPRTAVSDKAWDDEDYPNYYGRLYIPSVGIDVALYLDISQYVCDRWDSACFFDIYPYSGMIIGDHCNQEFATLTGVTPGCTGRIVAKDGAVTYIRCAEAYRGHNTGDDIVDNSYCNVMGRYDYLAYTCMDGWQNIWICQFETVGHGFESLEAAPDEPEEDLSGGWEPVAWEEYTPQEVWYEEPAAEVYTVGEYPAEEYYAEEYYVEDYAAEENSAEQPAAEEDGPEEDSAGTIARRAVSKRITAMPAAVRISAAGHTLNEARSYKNQSSLKPIWFQGTLCYAGTLAGIAPQPCLTRVV